MRSGSSLKKNQTRRALKMIRLPTTIPLQHASLLAKSVQSEKSACAKNGILLSLTTHHLQIVVTVSKLSRFHLIRQKQMKQSTAIA